MPDDIQLQKSVQAELAWEPRVTAAHIGVTAKNGVVTLTGHVGSFAEKRAAELSTLHVKGVKAVAEDLEVHLAPDMQRSDEQIAGCVLDRLLYDTLLPQDAIKVEVAKGWITLTGEVEWFFQKEAAEQDIHRLVGVKGVSNNIDIRPNVDASNISDNITHALHRSWFFDPQTIKVTALGGNVRLTGTVQSPENRQLAARTAWAAPGVTDVENDIAVV